MLTIFGSGTLSATRLFSAERLKRLHRELRTYPGKPFQDNNCFILQTCWLKAFGVLHNLTDLEYKLRAQPIL